MYTRIPVPARTGTGFVPVPVPFEIYNMNDVCLCILLQNCCDPQRLFYAFSPNFAQVFHGNISLPMIIDYLIFLLKLFHEYIIGITSHFKSSNFNCGSAYKSLFSIVGLRSYAAKS